MVNFGFKKLSCAMLSAALIAGSVMTGYTATEAHAAKSKLHSVIKKKTKENALVLVQGKGEVIDIKKGFSDVLVANPSLVDVTALQSNRLYLVGLSVGDTNLVILDNLGNIVKRLDVHVQIDTVRIQDVIEDMFPDEHVRVSSVHDQIVLTGKVSTPSVANRIARVTAAYTSEVQDIEGSIDELIVNMLEVQAEQQVMLKMRVIEASRDVIKELGIDPQLNATVDGVITSQAGDISTFLGVTNNTGLTRDPLAQSLTVIESGIDGIGDINLLINLLEQDNLVNILAEPNLSSISGEQAGFLAGGEFPVPVGRDRDGNVVIEFRPFGVSLNFRPTVMSEERISLQLEAEVSSLSQENAITLSDISVPGLDVRRAETTVEMGSGASLMIAGLLKSEAVKGMSGLPGVKDTPVIGDLVKSDSFQREETELVIMITPYLVRPYKDKEQAVVRPLPSGNKALSKAFAQNMGRVFGDVMPSRLFLNQMGPYGYLID